MSWATCPGLVHGRRANPFFRLVAARYTRGSLMITSNLVFGGWGKLVGGDAIASAILNPLLHHSESVASDGPSYGLKDKLGSGSLERRASD
jgi:DNA replication protein DnaC